VTIEEGAGGGCNVVGQFVGINGKKLEKWIESEY
jgi:hypothetical protein